MRLGAAEYRELEGALADTFTSYDDLGLALSRSGRQIENIVQPKAMPFVLNAVIRFAESRDSIAELVTAARESNPTNKSLYRVAVAMGIEPGGVAVAGLAGDEALAQATAHLERMVEPSRGIADLGSFAAKIQELVGQVCAVELGKSSGTGFLIGPETVITNHHVVKSAIEGGFPPADIRLRFDYQRDRDGITTRAGTEIALADAWLVACEPHSAADETAYDPSVMPAENELDFAVLRTRTKVGRDPRPGSVDGTRGWIAPTAQAFEFAQGSYLMIVQHPCHDPIAYDDRDDAVILANGNDTRVQYRINTMPGSSGSPVLDRDLELVALHHAGQPGNADFMLDCHQQVSPAAYNEGVPIAKIQAALAAKGLSWAFGEDGP
jgi:hypothetical protein